MPTALVILLAGFVWWRSTQIRRRNPDRADLYEQFHGGTPRRRRWVDVPAPRGALMKIGRLEEIVYAPEVPSRLRGKEFVHEFGDTGTIKLPDKPVLATDGRNLFVLRDRSRYYFNERGIIG